MGGPLLVSLKIATAVALARKRTQAGHPTVAVFWNASEDHDLDEANRLYLRTPDRTSTELHHLDLDGHGRALESIVFRASHREKLEELFSNSGERLGSPEDLPLPDEDFGRWMGRIQSTHFRGTGLLVIEPRDLIPLARPIKRRIANREGDLRQAWESRRQTLIDLSFETQLGSLPAEQSLFLFHDDEGKRRRLHRDARGLLLDGQPLDTSRDEVIDRMTPSALIRPLVQQALMPVVTQVSGPAEIRYLFEASALADCVDIDLPAPWPRVRGSLLTKSEAAIAETHRLKDHPLDANNLRTHIAETSSSERPSAWTKFETDLQTRSTEFLAATKEQADDDRILVEQCDAFERNLQRQLRDLSQKLEKAERRLNRDQRLRSERLREALFPRETPQERIRPHCCYSPRSSRPLGTDLVDLIDPENPLARLIFWETSA